MPDFTIAGLMKQKYPITLGFPDRAILEPLIDKLKEYELKIDEDFMEKEGRWPQPADKIWKIVEELGEVRGAHNKLDEIEEIWDSAIGCIGLALLKQYPTEQILNGLERVLRKLDDRWGENGHGRPEKTRG